MGEISIESPKPKQRGEKFIMIGSLVMLASMVPVLKNAWDAKTTSEKKATPEATIVRVIDEIGDPYSAQNSEAHPAQVRDYFAAKAEYDQYEQDTFDQLVVAEKWGLGGALGSLAFVGTGLAVRRRQQADESPQPPLVEYDYGD